MFKKIEILILVSSWIHHQLIDRSLPIRPLCVKWPQADMLPWQRQRQQGPRAFVNTCQQQYVAPIPILLAYRKKKKILLLNE